MTRRRAWIGDARDNGWLRGIERVTHRAAKAPAPNTAELTLDRALSRGLSPKTRTGHGLTMTPPLITPITQMDAALEILGNCLATA